MPMATASAAQAVSRCAWRSLRPGRIRPRSATSHGSHARTLRTGSVSSSLPSSTCGLCTSSPSSSSSSSSSSSTSSTSKPLRSSQLFSKSAPARRSRAARAFPVASGSGNGSSGSGSYGGIRSEGVNGYAGMSLNGGPAGVAVQFPRRVMSTPTGSTFNGTLAGEDWLVLQESRSENRLKIFSGTANPQLAQEIAACMGLELGRILIKRFADGELYVQVQESVRGCDVFLVQPTCPPANENLMELLIMIDACRRASAKTITAVIPYFGYARADRKSQGRESIAAKLVANLITEAGAHRVLTCDLHSGQSVGYFDIPVDQVYGQPVILDYLASKRLSSNDVVVVSPDVGGVARARAFAKKLSDAPLAIVDKRRSGHNVAEVMNLIGDVRGKVAILVDDMIDTAGTICKGAALLRDAGASQVYACCTHAVFSPPAVERLSSGLLQEVIATNTIPIAPERSFPQLTILSMANLLGETIWRVHDDSAVACDRLPTATGLDID